MSGYPTEARYMVLIPPQSEPGYDLGTTCRTMPWLIVNVYHDFAEAEEMARSCSGIVLEMKQVIL